MQKCTSSFNYFKFLRKCDVIAFMKDGTITELGTHEELVANDKDYNQLISLDQAKRHETDDERKVGSDENYLTGNVCDLSDPRRPNKEVVGLTHSTEDEEVDNYIVDEGETLKYSSWSVLLEYFKVSYNHVIKLFFSRL